MAEQKELKDIQIDAANLYREETYTDLKAGSIRKMVPIKVDGSDDPDREPMFTAMTQVMTPGGILPLNGEVKDAKTLEEALKGFPETIHAAVERLRAEMEAMQRERASQIVVPGKGGVPPAPSSDLII